MKKMSIDLTGTNLQYQKQKQSRPNLDVIELIIAGEDLQIWTRDDAKKLLTTFNIFNHKDTIERETIEIVNVKTHGGTVQLEIGFPGSPEIVLEEKNGNIEGVYVSKL